MKTWQRFKNVLLSGEWHVHTNRVDGIGTVDELCTRAVDLGIPLMAFTEHVGHGARYDLQAFLDEVDSARDRYDMTILTGCEASILPGGELDVDSGFLDEVNYPIVSFHAFPVDAAAYLEALFEVLRNPRVNTWAHPGAWLMSHGMTMDDDDLEDVFRTMASNDVALEINAKYDVPDARWLRMAKHTGVSLIRGSDIHDVKDLRP